MSSTNHIASTASAKDGKTISLRRVEFSHSTKAHFIAGLWEMSEEEKKATWLTDEDNAQLQSTIFKTVKRMRQGKELNEEKYCARGLEHMGTADLLKQKEANKAAIRNAVLKEQRRQTLSGYYDDEKLRQISLLHSKNPRLAALNKGTSDAAVEGFVVESCPARICEDKVSNYQDNGYYAVGQCIEKDACISVLENDDTQDDAESRTTNQLNASKDKPCSPDRGLFRTWKSDADYSIGIEKKQGPSSSPDHVCFANVFNRVLFKISRGLEGEADQGKIKREVSDDTPGNRLNNNGNVSSKSFKKDTAQSKKWIDSMTQRRFVPNCA